MSLRLKGSTSGYVELEAAATSSNNTLTLPNGNGTSGQVLQTDGSGALSWSDNTTLVMSTPQSSTSGTSIDFTDIPSWVKRITVMFSGVSTNGTSEVILRIGTSSGIQATGYLTTSSVIAAAVLSINDTTGFRIYNNGGAATNIRHGVVNFVLLDASSGIWDATGYIGLSDGARMSIVAGSKTLSGTLDRIRITTVNGTDTFDAGSINIMYE